jgi:hypothetical protein
MLQEITSWCNRNPILCAVIVLFILFYTGMLQELLRCLGIEGLAPFPASVDSGYMNPKSKGGLDMAAAAGSLPSVPPQRAQLKAADLLPTEQASAIQEFNIAKPIGEGILQDINSLKAGYHVGIDTVGQTLRNANRQIRSEPTNPQVPVSPFMNTTIAPDLMRKPLELGVSV